MFDVIFECQVKVSCTLHNYRLVTVDERGMSCPPGGGGYKG